MELCPSVASSKKTQRYDSSPLFISSFAYILQNLASEHAYPEAQHGMGVSAAKTDNGTMTTEDSPVRKYIYNTPPIISYG
jgi:hypothetical protein